MPSPTRNLIKSDQIPHCRIWNRSGFCRLGHGNPSSTLCLWRVSKWTECEICVPSSMPFLYVAVRQAKKNPPFSFLALFIKILKWLLIEWITSIVRDQILLSTSDFCSHQRRLWSSKCKKMVIWLHILISPSIEHWTLIKPIFIDFSFLLTV